MNKGTKLKKSRKIGFLIRMSTKSGRRIINNKRRKKRKQITN
uniref:50S ribosomal protein L34 n=1 Tax=Laurencia verruciformis TaxID=3073068 RepID=A0AA51REL3_9FLOR|nr:50S ribosomal protein L34 [Laurencia obtusa]WMP12156.1 50S ribosomal protein L34 [Laurencia verruciformis]WMP12799.1 50S ribosomal protein L34 [Laurencia obtusa]